MMNRKKLCQTSVHVLYCILTAICFLVFSVIAVPAQSGEMQQRIAELKESMAKNKQALSHYTWKEQVAISLKGEQRKVEHFQVKMGPDGKPQRTPLDSPREDQAERGGGRRGRLRQRII